MKSRHHRSRRVAPWFGLAVFCLAGASGCVTSTTASPSPASRSPAAVATAVADVTVTYKGQRVSEARIATYLGKEARVDTMTDDGHSAALRVVINDDGAGHYHTSLDVLYDGAVITLANFLSAPGQSAVSQGEDVHVTLRVSPGA